MNENVPFEERKWTEEKEIERRKWELERTRNEAERAHDKSNAFHTYVNEATIEASNLALRTLVLINGGAAVAILAFLGAVASKDKVDFDQVGRVAGTLRFYAIGVACAVAAMAFAYLANFFMVAIETKRDRVYEHPYIRDNAESRRMRRFNRISHFVSFLFGLASLALFIAGMWTTGSKVTQLIESRTVSKAVGQ